MFCSIECANKSKIHRKAKKIEKKCLVCSEKFFVNKSRDKTAFYCSKKCQMIGRLKRKWNSKSLKKECLNCNKEFSTYKSINRECCSKDCAIILKRKRNWNKFKQTCIVCGVEFKPKRPGDGGYFCSYKCTGLSNRLDKVNRSGYWYLYRPDHPDSSEQGYIAEHRIVMENKIGRRLNNNEIVHHKDHIKTNNNPDNLEIMSLSEHSSYHAKHMWETRDRTNIFVKKDLINNEH